MKEQEKKLDSDTKFLINIEDGASTIINLANPNGGCKRGLLSLKVIIPLLSLIVCLIYLNKNAIFHIVNESEKHNPESKVSFDDNQAKEVAFSDKVYESTRVEIGTISPLDKISNLPSNEFADNSKSSKTFVPLSDSSKAIEHDDYQHKQEIVFEQQDFEPAVILPITKDFAALEHSTSNIRKKIDVFIEPIERDVDILDVFKDITNTFSVNKPFLSIINGNSEFMSKEVAGKFLFNSNNKDIFEDFQTNLDVDEIYRENLEKFYDQLKQDNLDLMSLDNSNGSN